MDTSEISQDLERQVGEWLLEEVQKQIVIEKSGWAKERVTKVAKRLNSIRPGCEVLKPVVIWVPQVTAFIAPGGYIYISRELLQRLICEDAVAFLLAHEMAHYDLGHVRLFVPAISKLQYIPGGGLLALSYLRGRRLLPAPDKERQADEYGLGLCLAAGYDGYRCLELFEVLTAHYLDFGDLTGVFGKEKPGSDVDDLLPEGFKRWWDGVKGAIERRSLTHDYLSVREGHLRDRLGILGF
ncbi:MAG: M48 family metalloprotease [Okeania sp. SIO2H7]|nr:M48 family metalloprotease [Okeania sp. SIO2H7]